MGLPSIQRIIKIKPKRGKRIKPRKPASKPTSIYNTEAYKRWRARVFKRDNYMCQMCHAKRTKNHQIRIEAHHIMRKVDFPEMIFVVSNGITLCQECHRMVTGQEMDYAEHFTNVVKTKGRRPSDPYYAEFQ